MIRALGQHILLGLAKGHLSTWVISGTVALAGLGAAAMTTPISQTTPVTTTATSTTPSLPAQTFSYNGGPCHHDHGNGGSDVYSGNWR